MKRFQGPGLRTKPNYKNYNNNYFPPTYNPRNLPIIYPGKPVERRSIDKKSGGFNIQRTIYNMRMQNLPKYINKAKKYVRKGEKIYREVKPYWDKYAPKSWKKKVGTGLAVFTGAKRIFAKEVSSISGEITKSNFTYGKKDASYYKKYFKEAQEYELIFDSTKQISTTTGSQAMAQFTFMGMADLLNIANALNTQNINNSANTNYSQKFGVCKNRVTTTFSNSGNNNLIMELYEIIPRRDQLFNSSDTGTNLYFPPDSCMTNSWVNQRAAQGTGTSYASLTNTTYGATPYDNQMFNFFYEVLKVQKITLSPGSSHEHNSEYFINGKLSTALLKSSDPGIDYGCLRGFYHCLLVRQYGLPVHDATTTNNISIGPTRCDVTQNQVQTFHDYVNSNMITLRVSSQFDSVIEPEQVVVNNPTDTASVNTD